MASIELKRGPVTATISLSEKETEAVFKELGANAKGSLLKLAEGFFKEK